MNEELPLALHIYTKAEIKKILQDNICPYNMSEDDILKFLMRYFKGRCNPGQLRETLKEI